MKLGMVKNFFFYLILFLASTFPLIAEDKIDVVPLINLEELSPTFEEGKDELEKTDINDMNFNESDNISDSINFSNNSSKISIF